MNLHPAALMLAALGIGMLRRPRIAQARETDGQPPATPRIQEPGSMAPSVRLGGAVAVWFAIALLMGGWAGLVLGGLVGVAAGHLLRRLEPAAVRRRRGRRVAELPVALDLLAVCLRAGTPFVAACEIVASALTGVLADDLRVVAALQRLGATPAASWSDYSQDPVLSPVAEAVARSAESGSRLADSFERLASDRRAELVLDGEARARRAGVLAMAPLGLCFLPAFVSLGIVPLVLSIASTVLAGTGG
jgi:pilus assembly protein TadC